MVCVTLRLVLDVGLVVAPLVHRLTYAVSAPLMTMRRPWAPLICLLTYAVSAPLVKMRRPRMMFPLVEFYVPATTTVPATTPR